ncbi:ADP-ribosyl-(dinitrogen reductase) hydrolase [Comamonas sp. J-3]|uniref:ADP-ribosyl-(dinitrogen reductase) hydrolase n=1 Tax=Comamonas trifloxystrobinivorans TaxID=3350256 RepID=UPI00372897A6
MKNLLIFPAIEEKLEKKHQVTRREVEQCFANFEGPLLIDDREDHRTNPPTHWFLACTNQGRLLKVVFILRDGKIFLRTCYVPNQDEMRIYNDALEAK